MACNPLHSAQKVDDGIHIPYAFEFADETEMNSSSVTADDLGKFARVDYDDSIWMLTSISPLTWVPLGQKVSLDGYATYSGLGDILDGYLTDGDHRGLDQLVHAIAETSYEEITYSGSTANSLIIWTNSGKTKKIREELYTYGSGNHVTTIVTKQYDSAGAVVETLTENYTWSGGQVINITRTLT